VTLTCTHTTTTCNPRPAITDEVIKVSNHHEAAARLDARMCLIKEGTLSPCDLSPEEIRCLWQRMKTRLWKPDGHAVSAKAVWEAISTSGTGNAYKKRMLLFAWPSSYIVVQNGVFVSCGIDSVAAVIV